MLLLPTDQNRNASRRNGKPASCEPCRINKTKCDHGMPKCDRCKQRGIEERCFYHPAPLTKPRNNDETGTGESRPLKRKYVDSAASVRSELINLDDRPDRHHLRLSTLSHPPHPTTSSQMQSLLMSIIPVSLDLAPMPCFFLKMKSRVSLENAKSQLRPNGPIGS
jgi:hypothetical protein